MSSSCRVQFRISGLDISHGGAYGEGIVDVMIFFFFFFMMNCNDS